MKTAVVRRSRNTRAAQATITTRKRRRMRGGSGTSAHTSLPPPPSAAAAERDNARAEFTCVITQALFKDPVVAADGFIYEKKAIETWMRRNHNRSFRSPHTNEIMASQTLEEPPMEFMDSLNAYVLANEADPDTPTKAVLAAKKRMRYNKRMSRQMADHVGRHPTEPPTTQDRRGLYSQPMAQLDAYWASLPAADRSNRRLRVEYEREVQYIKDAWDSRFNPHIYYKFDAPEGVPTYPYPEVER